MQRPSGGYRGGIRVGSHQTSQNHRLVNERQDDEDERLTISNSNSDENDDLDDEEIHQQSSRYEMKKYSKIIVPSDFESAIRNLRPSATRQKKSKTNLNVSKQKADLPQMSSANENNFVDETKSEEKSHQDRPSRQWFPKPDVGHLDSDAFIRHNHIEPQKFSDVIEHSAPPALLTAIPPVGVSTRPTAIVAPAGPTRSVSSLFSSKSSVKQANSSTPSKLPDQQETKSSFLIQTPTSAFQPIQNLLHRQSTRKSSPILMDIPQHKSLERGQHLKHVHISHPQSPSIVHLMLKEGFNTACRLLHDMAAHPELQLDFVPTRPFKAQANRLCACFHEGRWFRCRILQISSDYSTATVVYLDWGMIIPMPIGPEYIRRLPNEFYSEPACSILCHLDGVPNTNDSMAADVIAQCISLLSENEYDVTVNGFDSNTGGKVILSVDGRIVNDQIKELLEPNVTMTAEEELIEQFQHELPLAIGDELKALLSSFSGKDDAFYVLLVNQNTLAIDQAMSQLQETSLPDQCSTEIPRVKTLVVARYSDDGKWYRAWIKSISLQRQQALVFFVDFGNESSVAFSDIYTCPESVRTLPWLGIRIRLIDEKMSYDELVQFWKLAESNYIWIKIIEIFKDSYGVQIKVDYTVVLRHERMKLSQSHRLTHMAVQTNLDETQLSTVCPSNSSEINSHVLTPSLNDQNQLVNENLFRNLFEMISKELRHLRHRITDSDEASQDRHSQLMQLLFSSFNLNNSNNSKRL